MSTTQELLINIANNIPNIYNAGRDAGFDAGRETPTQKISIDTVSFDSNFSSGLAYLPHSLGAKPDFAILYANNVENAIIEDVQATVILTFSFLQGNTPTYMRQDSNGTCATGTASTGKGILLDESSNATHICVAPIANAYPFPSSDYTDFTLICTCGKTQEATTNET